MENTALVSPSSTRLVLGCSANPRVVSVTVSNEPFFGLPRLCRLGSRNTKPISAFSSSSSDHPAPAPIRVNKAIVLEKLGKRDYFASISSSSGQETSSIGVPPQYPLPPQSSTMGSPLFWIGVGVGVSALFSWAATNLKKYAMQQAFKTLMGQMNSQNGQFSNSAYPPGSPFTYPPPPASGPATTPSPAAAQSVVTVDVPATQVETPSATDVKDNVQPEEKPRKYAFVDVSPAETFHKSPFEISSKSTETDSSKDSQFPSQVPQNGAAFQPQIGSSKTSSTGKANPVLSVEALEKMMEDPTIQKMVYLYLPEEMRNPETFKWMLQNPQYRQQLQDMLNNVGGSAEWDNQMMDSLKNFDLNSPEVKQQFDQIGLTPEQLISKIMANPDVAMAFQNPRVQQAIMDCSQNPLSITKYQNDKEVMDVFNKISELFPGVTGS